MDRVTLRLPDHVIAAYDRSDGNRSALMRNELTKAVESGELKNTPEDLIKLAAVDMAASTGKLDNRQGTFKKRLHEWAGEHWDSGAVTGVDMTSMLASWREEAALFGSEYVAFVDALEDWYTENYDPEKVGTDFVSAQRLVAESDPESASVDAALVSLLESAADSGVAKEDATRHALKFHEPELVEECAEVAYAGDD